MEQNSNAIKTAEYNEATLAQAGPDVMVGVVLTAEGRVWRPEGLCEATDAVYERCPGENPAGGGILWFMGRALNDPFILADLLEKRQDAWIVISDDPDSSIMPHDEGLNLYYAGILKENARDDDGTEWSSWSILAGLLEKIDKEIAEDEEREKEKG